MPFSNIKATIAKKLIHYTEYWRLREIRAYPGIHPTAGIQPGVSITRGVQIGRKSFVNGPGTLIDSGMIGAFCSIACHTVIGPGEHPLDAVTTHLEWPLVAYEEEWKNPKPEPVIGNDVWIGAGAILLRGAVIEDGAVIGAGAIVRGHIPAYAIAVGVPAKVIRYRFDEETIAKLKATKWWEWDDATLHKAYPYFNDIPRFLKLYS